MPDDTPHWLNVAKAIVQPTAPPGHGPGCTYFTEGVMANPDCPVCGVWVRSYAAQAKWREESGLDWDDYEAGRPDRQSPEMAARSGRRIARNWGPW